MGSATFMLLVHFTRADASLRSGENAAAAPFLAEALRLAREAGVVNYPGWRSDFMSRLLAKALALDIETDYALSLIRRHRLAPPAEALDSGIWPWPVTIRALGRFELVCGNRPLAAGGKGQTRPLELLKAVIALGGRDVPEERVAELLWPDAEGDRVRHSFKITLHRLRALLGEEPVLRADKGLLTLDAERVWLDVWAFERSLGALEAALGARREEPLSPLAEQLVSLYRGPFLDADTAAWALAARERLRTRFLRLLAQAAEALAPREPHAAIALYEKAL
jgi:hypothetical protein